MPALRWLCILLAKHGLSDIESDLEPCSGETCPSASTLMQVKSGRRSLIRDSEEEQPSKAEVSTRSKNFSFVSLRGDRSGEIVVPSATRHAETTDDCKELMVGLKDQKEVSEIFEVIKFICKDDARRRRFIELKNGCLYLPNNEHWQAFLDLVEQPNPWGFLNMFEDSFIPLGDGEKCPDMNPTSVAKTVHGLEIEGCESESGLTTTTGRCARTRALINTIHSNIHVRVVDALMALNPGWEHMITHRGHGEDMKTSFAESIRRQREHQTASKFVKNLKVEIPIKYFVCDIPGSQTFSNAVSDQMLKDQTRILNKGFAGGLLCENKVDGTEKVDTRISFRHMGTERLQHMACRHDCNDHVEELVREVVPREEAVIKVLLCSTDLLGSASSPTTRDQTRICLMTPGSLPGGSFKRYDKGATLTHLLGRYMGLPRTCDNTGDQVFDTRAEQEMFQDCLSYSRRNSCGSHNPHNFMENSEDRCLCSFATGQVNRMWGFMETDMRDFLKLATPIGSKPTRTSVLQQDLHKIAEVNVRIGRSPGARGGYVCADVGSEVFCGEGRFGGFEIYMVGTAVCVHKQGGWSHNLSLTCSKK